MSGLEFTLQGEKLEINRQNRHFSRKVHAAAKIAISAVKFTLQRENCHFSRKVHAAGAKIAISAVKFTLQRENCQFNCKIAISGVNGTKKAGKFPNQAENCQFNRKIAAARAKPALSGANPGAVLLETAELWRGTDDGQIAPGTFELPLGLQAPEGTFRLGRQHP